MTRTIDPATLPDDHRAAFGKLLSKAGEVFVGKTKLEEGKRTVRATIDVEGEAITLAPSTGSPGTLAIVPTLTIEELFVGALLVAKGQKAGVEAPNVIASVQQAARAVARKMQTKDGAAQIAGAIETARTSMLTAATEAGLTKQQTIGGTAGRAGATTCKPTVHIVKFEAE